MTEIDSDLVWVPIPDPCYLLAFTAESIEAGVLLSWSVNGLPASSCLHVYREGAGGSREQVSSALFCGEEEQEFLDPYELSAEVCYWLRELQEDDQAVWLGSVRVPPHGFREGFFLAPNHPNPFNPATRLEYDLPRPGFVSLTVHDAQGHKVATLVAARQTAGAQAVTWNGKSSTGAEVPSGVYFVRLVSGQNQQTRKIVLLR
jgi:hypothetical protein